VVERIWNFEVSGLFLRGKKKKKPWTRSTGRGPRPASVHDGAMAVKAAVEERSARARSGHRERGRRGRGGVVRRGGARVSFYRVRGGAGRLDGEGNWAVGVGAPLWAIRFGGEGKQRG
jgi:hypothetical protein